MVCLRLWNVYFLKNLYHGGLSDVIACFCIFWNAIFIYPAREIAKVLLVRVFRIVLVERDELVAKVQIHMTAWLYKPETTCHAQTQPPPPA